MRVFIAIEFNDEVKDFLAQIQQGLRTMCTKGNFSRRDNFHLTLRFIGEVEENRLPAIKSVVSSVARESAGFTLELGGLGQFLKGNRSVVWVGVKPSSRLTMLYQKLEDALEQQGFIRENRGYNPHITMAREVGREQAVTAINTVKAGSQMQTVEGISLMQSTREDGMLVYKPLFRQQICKSPEI